VLGNAAAAAQRSGHGPRKAKILMGNAAIKAEIGKRKAEAAPKPVTGKLSVETLIAEADAALRVAQENNNVAAQVSAIQLKARLSGLLNTDGEAAKTATDENIDIKVVMRAILDVFAEATHGKRIVIVLEHGHIVSISVDGEELVEKEPQQTVADELAIAPAAVEPEAPATISKLPKQPLVGEREVFSNGAWIELVIISGSNAKKWAVYSPDAVLCGYRRSQEDARTFAEGLVAANEVDTI
jgi:hypothetical protein